MLISGGSGGAVAVIPAGMVCACELRAALMFQKKRHYAVEGELWRACQRLSVGRITV